MISYTRLLSLSIVAGALLVGCRDPSVTRPSTETRASGSLAPPPPPDGSGGGAAGQVFTAPDGEYFASYQYGQLAPTWVRPARIESQHSEARLDCDGMNTCTSAFSASHDGNWHWSRQSLHFWVVDANGGPTLVDQSVDRSGGDVCLSPLTLNGIPTFCTQRRQSNTHSAGSVETNACKVQASVSTTHRAGWGKLATLSISGWSVDIFAFGENSQGSNGKAIYDECSYVGDPPAPSLCDDPGTATVEQCSSATPALGGAPLRYGQPYVTTVQTSITVEETCHYTHWWYSWDGGRTWQDGGRTLDYCEQRIYAT